jgi:hypothetical protein
MNSGPGVVVHACNPSAQEAWAIEQDLAQKRKEGRKEGQVLVAQTYNPSYLGG